MQRRSTLRLISSVVTPVLVLLLVGGFSVLPTWGISKISQPSLPEGLNVVDGAILEENDVFFSFMTERAVRTLAKSAADIVERDPEGDSDFIRDHRDKNGDYWYWAHLKAREALVMALGSQPKEAIKVIDTIPYNDYLVPEYRWIVTPDFRAYLETAEEDLAYYYDAYIGLNVFFTNYQVSQLEREYLNVRIRSGPRRGSVIRAKIPLLEINLRDLVATPREGEEETVGLNAILQVSPEGITDSLLPSSEEYNKREPSMQEKLITASDWRLKRIPVATNEARLLLQEPLMAQSMKFLKIEGSMRADGESTTFSEDLKITVNKDSGLGEFLEMHRLAFKDAEIKKAE